jgi:hypothetical protein
MDFKEEITNAIKAYSDNSARSIQSADGILGPSDIGFCRQKAALMISGVKQTDETPKWAAAVGTSVHNYVEAAIKAVHSDWLLGSIDDLVVTATLPSGAAISGHPDIVIPNENTVLDIKTVDGFQWVKRNGTSQQHKYQRHLYAMGCIAAGVFDNSKTVYVGNIYFDRSGKEAEPYIIVEEFDPTLTDEIDSWVQDVIYAVKNDEDASRDIPAAVCEKICSHFTACRGGLEINDGGEFIDDTILVSAIDMYTEARDMEKTAKKMKDEASSVLHGINGSTGTWQVRWVDVAPTTVNSFQKDGYSRLDIRKVRKAT